MPAHGKIGREEDALESNLIKKLNAFGFREKVVMYDIAYGRHYAYFVR